MTIPRRKLPTVINKSAEDVDDYIRRIKESNLDQDAREFVAGCVEVATWLPEALEKNQITIWQLRKLIFGDSPRKKKSKDSNKNESGNSNDADKSLEAKANENESEPESDSTQPENCLTPVDVDSENAPPKKGHGRYSHEVYSNAIIIPVQHIQLKIGDDCLTACGGKLYQLKDPGILIRITGNALATVSKYELEKFRCSLCGDIFLPELPKNIPPYKYDARLKAILANQKYYLGMPFYRQANFQRNMALPIAPSTQFELCEDVADCAYPIISVLEKGVANDKLVQNDDTHVKILSVIKDNRENPKKERMGTYTTCVMGKMDGHSVALYYSGVKHAGENLASILQHRDPEKPPILQMCDALSANVPKSMKTILCNCLGHGFRKFRDLVDFYPEPCLHIIHELGKVFAFEEKTRGMTEQERFQFHRLHSKPVMLKLNWWLKNQLAEKKVEPNSPLGKSMKYLLRHWKKLRRFLVRPGCPIDNNIVERSLKIPIRVRKAAMFYKTLHGASIGSILTSLIQTTILSKENPVEYLVALQENKSGVFKDPMAWLPWRYRDTMQAETFLKAA